MKQKHTECNNLYVKHTIEICTWHIIPNEYWICLQQGELIYVKHVDLAGKWRNDPFTRFVIKIATVRSIAIRFIVQSCSVLMF